MIKKKFSTKMKKGMILLGTLALLMLSPTLFSATSTFNDDDKEYRYEIIMELKYGKDATQYTDDDLLYTISPTQFYKSSLADIQGMKVLLEKIKDNISIALYRSESNDSYKKVLKDEQKRVTDEQKSYQSLYGDNWLAKWNDQLKKDGYKTTEEYVLGKIRKTLTTAAFKEVYKTVDATYKDDNDTPNDTSDDKEIKYKTLGRNHLFWFKKWLTEKRPLHVAELKLTLKDGDDYNDVKMTDENKSKLDELISELVREASATSIESIDFSGLVTGYSKGTKTNGGDLGLVYYNDNSISSVLTKYNLYNFINDVYNNSLRSDSEIVLDENTTGDSFLDLFKTGERNYFYFQAKGEKFLVSRNGKSDISIYKIYGIKDYIDSETRKENYLYGDYFKDSPRIFKNFSKKPFDIVSVLETYIKNTYTNNGYILGRDKGIITFVNNNLIKDEDMGSRIDTYLKNIESARLEKALKSFFTVIEAQNKTWRKDKVTQSEIDVSRLKLTTAWAMWDK